jgi:hypothetical protein
METRVGAPNPETQEPYSLEGGHEPPISALLDEYGLSFDVPGLDEYKSEAPKAPKAEPGISELLDEYGLSFDVDLGDLSTKPDAPIITIEDKRRQRQSSELARSAKRVGRRLAWVACGAVVSLSTVVAGGNILANDSNDRESVELAAESAQPTPETTPTTMETTTTTQPATTTTEAPTTTTTTATPEQTTVAFEAGPGELVGTLRAPSICLETEIFGFSEQEKTEVRTGETYHPTIGNGDAIIDQLRPEDNIVASCPEVEAKEAQVQAETGINHTTRREYGAQQYQAVAGHEQHANGGYLAPFPGQEGNTVIAGHGSTYSAPFSDINFLNSGENVYFDRADGTTITYEVIGQETLPNNDYDPFLNYQNPNYPNTITIYRCGDIDGTTGSANIRVAVRLGQVDVNYDATNFNYNR